MKIRGRTSSGFSLIEVVLAVGIAGFALLSILSLFSLSIQTNTTTVEQVEALSVVKALPAFLRSVGDGNTPPNQGFVPVYNWVSNGNNPAPTATASAVASAPLLYAFNNPAGGAASTLTAIGVPGQSVIMAVPVPVDSSVRTTVIQAAAKRQGRLYGIYLSVSPNFPIGSTAYPTASTLAMYNPGPATPPMYPEGALALQVKVYTVPQVGLVPSAGSLPVLTYDLLLPH